MLSFNALQFPECFPVQRSAAHLLSFFDGVGYFPPDADSEVSGLPPEAKGLILALCPFEEDEDTDRFRHLIKELRGRGREFYLHTLSSLPTSSSAAEESSVVSLVNLLTGKSDDKSPALRKERERRWQARLVLQLSLMLAEEEREIRQSLDAISSQRRKMLAALQGEEQEDEAETAAAAAPDEHVFTALSEKQQRHVLNAWAYFYLASPKAFDMLPCTSQPAVVETLLEAYEKKSRQKAIELCTLPLSGLGGLEHPAYCEQRALLLQQTAEPRRQLCALLRQAREGLPSAAGIKESCGLAAAALRNNLRDAAVHPEGELRVFCLPELSFASLLASLPAGPSLEGSRTPPGNGLIALFSQS